MEILWRYYGVSIKIGRENRRKHYNILRVIAVVFYRKSKEIKI